MPKKIFTEISLAELLDKISILEIKLKKFNKNFTLLARKVYFTNDKRSQLKLKINTIMNSSIVEMKSYSKYN
jgi:hypothetical protein